MKKFLKLVSTHFTASLMLMTGCVSVSRSVPSLQMEQPRTNQGILTEDTKDDGLQRLAQALSPTTPATNQLPVTTAESHRLLGSDIDPGHKPTPPAVAARVNARTNELSQPAPLLQPMAVEHKRV